MKLNRIVGAVSATVAAVVIAAGCVSPSLAQSVLIDDFTSGPGFVGNSNDGIYAASGTQTGTMLGGSRYEDLLCFSDCYYDNPSYSTLSIGGGALSVTVPPDGSNTAQIEWGQASALNTNLSAERGIELTFSNVTAPLDVNLYLTSPGGTSLYAANYTASLQTTTSGVVIPAAASESVFLPFSNFYGSASVANVSQIDLFLGGSNYNNAIGTSSASYALDSVAAVPEPSTWATLVVGAFVVSFAVRRQRQALCCEALNRTYG